MLEKIPLKSISYMYALNLANLWRCFVAGCLFFGGLLICAATAFADTTDNDTNNNQNSSNASHSDGSGLGSSATTTTTTNSQSTQNTTSTANTSTSAGSSGAKDQENLTKLFEHAKYENFAKQKPICGFSLSSSADDSDSDSSGGAP